MNKKIIIAIVVLILIGGVWWLLNHQSSINSTDNSASEPNANSLSPASELEELPKAYIDAAGRFTIHYPADYLINTDYKYQGLGPGKEINGVKFTIPETLSAGANLSSFDTGVSVEIIPDAQNCNASLFLYGDIKPKAIIDGGREYSFASISEGAAGNFYEESVWALPETNPCIAVRYLIHSTNIANYPEGTVSEFDKNSLIGQFDKIRKSLIIL